MKMLLFSLSHTPTTRACFFFQHLRACLRNGPCTFCASLTEATTAVAPRATAQLSLGSFEDIPPPPPLQVRRREMYSAAMRFGATASVVEDPRLQDGGEWDACVVAEVARRGIEASFAVRGSCRRCVVTFDERGASGHKNHASTSRGLVLLRLASESQADSLFGTRFFELESAPFTSRFLGMLAVPVGLVRSRVDPQPSVLYANLDVITAFCALAVHETQFVWFRKLFLVFSSYTFLNRLIEIQRPIMPIHSLR